MTKEKENLVKAINAYAKKHKNNCTFLGCFNGFDKDDNVIDDVIVGYGEKGMMKLHIKQLQEELKDEKDEFVNW